MLKLIFNADDLGYSQGINEGILRAQQQGVVTNTTILMNRPATAAALQMAKRGEVTGVGVHLCLTSGQALTDREEIPDLVDSQGSFLGRDIAAKGVPPKEQVKIELEKQIRTAKESGLAITHLDSHHHIHHNPSILPVVAELALEYQLPVRSVTREMREFFRDRGVVTSDLFIGSFFEKNATLDALIVILREAKENLKAGVIEIMTHPAVLDDYLLANSSYTYDREKELSVLTDKKLVAEIDRLGCQLTSYEEI